MEEIMKISVEELEQALKHSEKKTKYELFLDENRDTILVMIEKGYSDSEIAKAINIYLAKINRMKKEARKKGEDIDESIKSAPAVIPKKVISKYLKLLRKELWKQNKSNSDSETVTQDKKNEVKETAVKDNKQDDILTNRKTVDFNDV